MRIADSAKNGLPSHREGREAMAKRKMNPNSLKNLIPNSQRTREELQAMGRKGGKTTSILNKIRWGVTIRFIYTGIDGKWGSFKVLEKKPKQAEEAIRRAVDKANRVLHEELEKEYRKMFKEYTGHFPHF